MKLKKKRSLKIRSFDFNVRELAGAMGDFGILLPLVIGYMVVCKVHPAGLLVMIGLANISTALIYRLPMPISAGSNDNSSSMDTGEGIYFRLDYGHEV